MKLLVVSPSRLHLGFYSIFSDDLVYGSIGVAIDNPNTRIMISKSKELKLINKSSTGIEELVKFVLDKLGIYNLSIEVLEVIPRHIGLGSTTQFTLSLGYGISKLLDLGYSIRELAFKLERGWVSGIGIAAFEGGGFILDSGREVVDGKVKGIGSIDDLPRVLYRKKIPRSWTFIVATPTGIKGLDEREERKYLETPEPNPEIEKKLHKTVLTEMLPALARNDIVKFGLAMTKVQLLTGEYFSKFQGGVFCCEETEFMINKFLEYGAYGAGQSSWGPTCYALVDSTYKARKILEKLKRDTFHKGIDMKVYISKVCNRGIKTANV